MLAGLLPLKVMNQSCVNEPRETSSMLSPAEGQPRFNCPCYCPPLLGSGLSLQAPGGMAIPTAHSLLHRAPVPSTKAEWSTTNECEARALLTTTLTLQCTTERCYSSTLLHPVGLHTPTSTVPSGSDFLQTATSYILAGSLYELHGSCCSPFRKHLPFGKISGPNFDVNIQLFFVVQNSG